VGRSRNIFTSSTILTACHIFTRIDSFCDDLLSPEIRLAWAFAYRARHLGPILSKLGFSRKIFIQFTEICQPGSTVVVGGETDLTKVIDVFRSYANAPKKSIRRVLMR
jgi:hypothetical protein